MKTTLKFILVILCKKREKAVPANRNSQFKILIIMAFSVIYLPEKSKCQTRNILVSFYHQ